MFLVVKNQGVKNRLAAGKKSRRKKPAFTGKKSRRKKTALRRFNFSLLPYHHFKEPVFTGNGCNGFKSSRCNRNHNMNV